ncbi:Nrap protein [Xylariales sp. PMI_506]|nr:Nrap protein [Xylariales sp. PMI_506]
MDSASSPPKRRKLSHSTSIAHQPSTFVLEIEELLKEVKVEYDAIFKGADELLREIKDSVDTIEPHGPLPIFETSAKFEKTHKVVIPYSEPQPAKDSQHKISLAKPSQCNVVGSYVSRTMIKSQDQFAIDMVIELPASLFQEKDYLNLRYIHKRAYYLANILVAVRKGLTSPVQLSYENLHDNPLLPILVVKPTQGKGTGKGGKKGDEEPTSQYIIRVIPCVPEGTFPKQKLLATANAIRPSHVDVANDAAAPLPTPFYNSTLKAESTFISYLKLIRKAEKSCSAYKDACILGRIWLNQRGLGGLITKGGFGHFEWSALMALLLEGGGKKGEAVLSASFSSTQLFRATIQFLATVDYVKGPVVIGSPKPDVQAITEVGAVIYDASRHLNLTYKMTASSAALLKQHARWTYSVLIDSTANQVWPTFVVRADLPLQSYDLLLELDMPEASETSAELDRQDPALLFSNKVYKVLKRALGNRVKLVYFQQNAKGRWDVSKSEPRAQAGSISVAVLFDATNMPRTIDRGPTVEEKEAAKKFRQFWGEKAELRRLNDGSIYESLIWTSKTPFDLCQEIIEYILGVQLSIKSQGLRFSGNDFAAHANLKPTDSLVFSSARKAFEAFEKDIREIEDADELPLRVRQVAPAAAQLRSASVKAPIADGRHAVEPINTVVYFEASGKWPDNLAAIQRTKIALLLRLASAFEENKPGVTAQVGLEARRDTENLAFLDITYKTGFTFRVRLHSDLEGNILERRTKDKTLEQHVKAENAQLLTTFERLYTHTPQHTQTIYTNCTRFPALSGSIRLVKAWFSAHKLTCHFHEELVELLVLGVFLKPYPWQAPSSPAAGFLRTLLFLSQWDWRDEPLVVDSAGDLAAADRAAISTKLQAWRKIDPSMNRVVIIASSSSSSSPQSDDSPRSSSSDASGIVFTTRDGEPSPSKVVATRMTTLARAACQAVRDGGIDLDPRVLFRSPLSVYDVRLHLSPRLCRALAQGRSSSAAAKKHSRFKNLEALAAAGGGPLPAVAHPPVRELLRRLDAAYAGTLVFFYGEPSHGDDDDNDGGDTVIGAIWNPQQLRASRAFRPTLPYSTKPTTAAASSSGRKRKSKGGEEDEEEGGRAQAGEELTVEVNRDGIVAEIARIGRELIEKIEVK